MSRDEYTIAGFLVLVLLWGLFVAWVTWNDEDRWP